MAQAAGVATTALVLHPSDDHDVRSRQRSQQRALRNVLNSAAVFYLLHVSQRAMQCHGAVNMAD